MASKKTFQILHTSDTHGYVYPFSYTTKKEQNSGLAKLSTLINQLRKKDSLLIDTGDTIQGSPLTYFHQKKMRDKTNPLTHVMNTMNYDYITIGNHEFNYGLDYLSGFLKEQSSTILNSNLLTDLPHFGKPYDVINFGGINIAIIGVTTHYIPNWEQPSHYQGFKILDAYQTTKKYVEKLRNSVDFIIVNYHGGFERNFETFELDVEDTGENQGSKMLKEIDGIDLLLTGHQHRSLLGTTFNTFYSQPGLNAQQVNEIIIDFTVDENSISHQITGNVHTTENIIPDQTIMELIKEEEIQTQLFLDTPVGTLDRDLLIHDQLQARLHKHPLVSFINQVQLDYTKADISLCSLGNSVSGFKKDISIRDVLGTYIFPNTLVVKEITGKILKQALEKTAEFFTIENGEITISPLFNTPKLQLYAYDMYDGIEYTLNISNEKGQKISSMTKDGIPIDQNDTFSIVMNNYRASGGGDYTFIRDCKTLHDTQVEVIELLIDYIVSHKHISIQHNRNITIEV